MKELEAQSLVIDAVRSSGGFAFKMSNRFLIGIPDLLMQLPDFGTSLWEVKIADYPLAGYWARVYPTVKQQQKLREYEKAGGFCGVISFLRAKDLHIAIMPGFREGEVALSNYTALKRGKREETIQRLLIKAHDGRPRTKTTKQPQSEIGG